jgi:hypothetical protein
MKNTVVAMFAVILTLLVGVCIAGEKEDILKKIDGVYVPKRLEPRSDLAGRDISFKLENRYLIVIETPKGLNPTKEEVPLDEIKEKADGYTFSHKFQGDISTSTIHLSSTGKITGESEAGGRRAEIEFTKK